MLTASYQKEGCHQRHTLLSICTPSCEWKNKNLTISLKMKNERMRKWNIYDVSVNAKLSTFNIIHYHSILFHITQVVHWRVVLINSAVPRLFAHRCWGISPIQVLVSHPYMCWYLTHTPNEVSLIELSFGVPLVLLRSSFSAPCVRSGKIVVR